MAKIFDFDVEQYSPGIARMNEDEWFYRHQTILLEMANTSEGRDLLCIDKSFPRIVGFAKNYIKGYLGMNNGKHVYCYQFRIGCKWANVIRYRWMDFDKLAKKFYHIEYNGKTLIKPNFLLDGVLVASRATNTFYPNPAGGSVDGFVGRDGGISESWNTIINGAGTVSDDSDTGDQCLRVDATATTDEFDGCYRGVFLFDTSAIGTGNQVTLATFSLNFSTVLQQFSSTININVVSSNPASNSALANTDYDIGDFGTTRYITDTDISGITTGVYTDFSMNSDGKSAISLDGVTKLGTRTAGDIDDSQTWESGKIAAAICDMSDKAGTTDDPKLYVESEAAGGAGIMTPKRTIW